MGSHLKKFWATHITWIGALIGFLDPSVQNWLASPSHIKYAALVGGASTGNCRELTRARIEQKIGKTGSLSS